MAATETPLRNGTTPVGQDSGEERFQRLKKEIHQHIVSAMDLESVGVMSDYELRHELRRGIGDLCQIRADLLSRNDQERLVDEVIDEALGLGPIDPLLRDPTITDILIDGPKRVYVERFGQLEDTNVAFHDDAHLVEIVQRIASKVGRRLDESSPMVDARLEDGSRVNAIIRPLALDGALVSIRRFGTHPLDALGLLARGALTREMFEFIAACVKARLNIVISGGTGSGKTTLLNMLSSLIPKNERIATIEDSAELRLQQPHVARMETRPANVEGNGMVTTRDLLRNSLRMRPDRIIVGECRGEEAFDMLQAMTTGHAGSLTTIHANGSRDALRRLQMLVGMAGFDLPMWFIHELIGSAIQIVIHCERLTGGQRTIVQITEITGIEGDVIQSHDVFRYEQTGLDAAGKSQGHHLATGIHPRCLDALSTRGCTLSPELFEERIMHAGRMDEFAVATASRKTS